MAKVLFVIYLPDEEQELKENPLKKKKDTAVDAPKRKEEKAHSDKAQPKSGGNDIKSSKEDETTGKGNVPSCDQSAPTTPTDPVLGTTSVTGADPSAPQQGPDEKKIADQSVTNTVNSKPQSNDCSPSVSRRNSSFPVTEEEDRHLKVLSKDFIRLQMLKDDFWDLDTPEATPVQQEKEVDCNSVLTENGDEPSQPLFMNIWFPQAQQEREKRESAEEATQQENSQARIAVQDQPTQNQEQQPQQQQQTQQMLQQSQQPQSQPLQTEQLQLVTKANDDQNHNKIIKPGEGENIKPLTNNVAPVQVPHSVGKTEDVDRPETRTTPIDRPVTPTMLTLSMQPLIPSDQESVNSFIGATGTSGIRESGGAIDDLEPAESGQLTPLLSRQPLKDEVQDVLTGLGVKNISWQKCHTTRVWQALFVADSGVKCERILEKLDEFGVGRIKKSSMSVLPITVHAEATETPEKEEREMDNDDEFEEYDYVPDEAELQKKSAFKESIKSRLLVAQVVESVESNARFTFDYLMLVILAGIIAALGLIENSSVALVASMLISPLMGPILAGTFGTVIKNYPLRNLGVYSELIGLAICLTTGICVGLITAVLEASGANWRSAEGWPTAEMTSRGVARGLVVGVLIALPSGAGVALSVLGGNTGSLVGVAISASLLPPAVNAGMLWSNALVTAARPPSLVMQSYQSNASNVTSIYTRAVINEKSALLCPQIVDNDYTHVYFCDSALDSFILGIISLLLTILNITCIFIMGVIILKVKEVAPNKTSSSKSAREFFRNDIKIARESYMTTKGAKSQQLGKQFLEEYKAMRAKGQEMDTTSEASETLEFQELLAEAEESVNTRGIARRLPNGVMPSQRVSEYMNDTFQQAAINHIQKHPEQVYLTYHATHGPPLTTHRRISSIDFPPLTPISSSQAVTMPLAPIAEGPAQTPLKGGWRGRWPMMLHLPMAVQHVPVMPAGARFRVTQISDHKEEGIQTAAAYTTPTEPASHPYKLRTRRDKKQKKEVSFGGRSPISNVAEQGEEVRECIPLLAVTPPSPSVEADTCVIFTGTHPVL